jgi:hypothetical protein
VHAVKKDQKTAAQKLLDRAVEGHHYAANCGRFLRQFVGLSEPSPSTLTFDDSDGVRLVFSDGVPPYVEKLFGAFGFDAKSPLDWVSLVRSLSLEFFPESQAAKRRGRHTTWDDGAYVKLLFDFNEAKSKSPNLSDDNICRLLERLPRYKPLKYRTIHRHLDRSRDPKLNGALKDMLRLIDDLMTEDENLPTLPESKLREFAIRALIKSFAQ